MSLLLICFSVIVLVLLAFILAETLKINYAVTPFVAACAIISVLFLFSIFRLLLFSLIFIYISVIVCACIVLFKVKIKAFVDFILSPPIIFFCFLSALFAVILLIKKPFFNIWDELSNWGPFYKSIFISNQIHIFNNYSNFGHADYPQASTYFYYFFARLFRNYQEDIAYIANTILLVACSTCLLGKTSWKKPFLAVISFAAASLIFYLFPCVSPYVSVYQDSILGAFFGATLILLISDSQNVLGKGIAISIALFAFVQVKDIALLFAFIICVIFAVFLFISGKDHFTIHKRKINRYLAYSCISVLMIIPPVLSKSIWLALVHRYHIVGQFVLKFSNIVNGLHELFFVRGSYARQLLKVNINAFNTIAVFLSSGHTAHFAFILLLTLGLLAASIIYVKTKNKNAVILNVAMPLFFIGYLAVLYILYLTVFSQYEALASASYDRYVGSFIIGWLMCILASALYYGDFKNVPFYKNLSAISIILTFYFVFQSLPSQNIFTSSNNYQSSSRLRFDTASEQFQSSFHSDDVVWVISQGDQGYNMWAYHYALLPVPVITSFAKWSLGTPKYSGDIWSTNFTVQEFRNFIATNKITYIIIDKSDSSLKTEFVNLFSDHLQNTDSNNPCLYKVTNKNGSYLQYIKTADIS